MPLPTKNLPSGRWIQTLEGYRAFHPNPLPPDLLWTPRLARVLSQADSLLGHLNAEGSRLPNPHILIRPFVCREAVYSSRIEGTQSTIGEILAVEAGAVVERSPADLREVANYVQAVHFGLERLATLPLSLRLVRELHEQLMAGVRGEHATPGLFRTTQNWIGHPGCTLNDASYVPPPPDALLEHLGLWENFLHDQTYPPLVQAALMHYQFEAIHPFLDGNGRVGRLLVTLCLCAWGKLSAPLLYLSAFFAATRDDYYNRLRAVTENGDWLGWLEYFLTGVARQAEDALDRTKRINRLLADWRIAAAKGGLPVAERLVDEIATNPYLTARTVEGRLKVSYNTAMRAIRHLQSCAVVEQVGANKRDRVFCARALLTILEEPPTIARAVDRISPES